MDGVWVYLSGIGFMLVFAVASYYVAKAKGRSTTLWTILGFFFTWVALLIVAVMPRKSPASSSPTPHAS